MALVGAVAVSRWRVSEEWQRGHRREHDVERRELETARRVVDHRLDDMNRLRHQIDTERGLYVSRDTADMQHNALAERIAALEKWKANVTGRLIVFAAASVPFLAGITILFNVITRK